MANRFPLIVDSSALQIKEIPANDNLDLANNSIVNVVDITASGNISVGGTFANNTNGQVGLTILVLDQSTGVQVSIASKIPVPAGSSFVISDTGKTLLEGNDALKVACDTNGAVDANISILTGVN